MNNKRNNKKIATLVLAGLAAGATAWFLFRTGKGKEFGSGLIGSIKDKMSDKLDSLSGHTGKIINELKSRADNVVKMPA